VNPPKKILVIKFRNIGDVLLTSPLISTLKRGGPDRKIYAVVKAGTEAILEGHQDLEKIYVLPQKNKDENRMHFFIRNLVWLRMLRKEKFDLAINTTEGDRGILLSFMIGAKERWCELQNNQERIWKKALLTKTLSPPTEKMHTVHRNLRLATTLAEEKNYAVTLRISARDRTRVTDLLSGKGYKKNKPLVHLHPTSRWFFKCLPSQTIAKLIDYLAHDDYQVALTCAPDSKEVEQLQEITSRCASKPINLGGLLTLKQTAALSEQANLFFGVDSAPMHMAAAVGTPVVSVFGPSGAFNWGPWPNAWDSEHNPYPARNGLQKNNSHIVVQKNWACIPCGKDGCEGTKKSACLDTVRAEEILSFVLERLNG
jgi:heptosyltransferase-3